MRRYPEEEVVSVLVCGVSSALLSVSCLLSGCLYLPSPPGVSPSLVALHAVSVAVSSLLFVFVSFLLCLCFFISLLSPFNSVSVSLSVSS